MTSGPYNVAGYNTIDIEFYFYSYSMENGEDFWVRFYDGSSWRTVAAYARGTNFDNNTFYVANISISAADYAFTNNAYFAFQCDASANADHIYIDQVTITATGGSSFLAQPTIVGTPVSLGEMEESIVLDNNIDNIDSANEVMLYPNPASDMLNIMIPTDTKVSTMNIYNVSGKLIRTLNTNEYQNAINVADFDTGIYFISIETENEVITKKFIKS